MRIISFFLGQKSHKLYVYFIFEIYLFINKSFSNYMQPAGTYDRMHSIHLNNKKKKKKHSEYYCYQSKSYNANKALYHIYCIRSLN